MVSSDEGLLCAQGSAHQKNDSMDEFCLISETRCTAGRRCRKATCCAAAFKTTSACLICCKWSVFFGLTQDALGSQLRVKAPKFLTLYLFDHTPKFMQRDQTSGVHDLVFGIAREYRYRQFRQRRTKLQLQPLQRCCARQYDICNRQQERV